VQPELVMNTMKFLIGPVPGFFFALAVYFVWLFPITKEMHEENTKQVLKERNRRSVILDKAKMDELAKKLEIGNGNKNGSGNGTDLEEVQLTMKGEDMGEKAL